MCAMIALAHATPFQAKIRASAGHTPVTQLRFRPRTTISWGRSAAARARVPCTLTAPATAERASHNQPSLP